MSSSHKSRGQYLEEVETLATGSNSDVKRKKNAESKSTVSAKIEEKQEEILNHVDEQLKRYELFQNYIMEKMAERKQTVEEYEFLKQDVTKMLMEGQSTLPNSEKYCIPFFEGNLRPYQFQGVKWMKLQDSLTCSSILADDMGLGKTVQTIALICDLIGSNVPGPFLIVVPLSTLYNWQSEFNRFAPKVPLVFYYGSVKERETLHKEFTQPVKINNYECMPVVLTTYQMLLKDKCHFVRVQWRFFVLDEGHLIKTKTSRITTYANLTSLACAQIASSLPNFSLCKSIPSSTRLLLTGTPLHNNIGELWSLLNFITPTLFQDYQWFEQFFDFNALVEASSLEQVMESKDTLDRIHKIIDPFILRRVKSQVESQLPVKKVYNIYASMTEAQTVLWKKAAEILREQLFGKEKMFVDISEFTGPMKLRPRGDDPATKDKPSEVKDVWGRILDEIKKRTVGMHTFRHISNHPLVFCPEEAARMGLDEFVASSGKLIVLDNLLTALFAENGHKVLLFTQYTMIVGMLELYCRLKQYDYSCFTGAMSISGRAKEMERFATDPNVKILLMTTRSGNLGLNLVAADTVIIYDSDWNPQADLQAEDRCHRIGQTKPVITYRLVTRNSIDELIYNRAANKRRLEKIIMHIGNFSVAKEKKLVLDAKQLLRMVTFKEQDAAISVKDQASTVLTEEDLKILLNRDRLDVPVHVVNDLSEDVKFEEV